jgi:S-DNA-T family DNA segregation ATPase FtsK/SpoIIIE
MTHRRRPWLLYVGAAVAALPVLFAIRHVPAPVWVAAVAVITTLGRVYLVASEHVWIVLDVAALALAVRVTWAAVRFARLPRAAKAHYPAACWHRLRWRWLARSLELSYVDEHRRAIRPVMFGTAAPLPAARPARSRVRFPRARFRPDPHGITASVKTVPNVGRAEIEAAAEHIANSWKCVRLSVSQPAPGRVLVRGLRTDPLCEPLSAAVLPVFDGRYLMLGRDDLSDLRSADLANVSGSAFSGNPGRGKTEAALSLAAQLVPSPLVDTWILDGGACDWASFADGAAGYVADDLEAAEDMLRVLDAAMCDRRRNLHAVRGSRNGWTLGPDPSYRLQWVLMEEAPFYLDLDAVRGDRKREDRVRACRGLTAGLLRRGRAPLFHTTLIAQKGTGTGGLPPDIRDLCGLRWSFGVATTEAAAAILGDDIRQHDTMNPTLLQGPDYVGVASVLLRSGQSPYTLVRFPAIGQDRADRAAASLIARNAAVVPDDASSLEVVTDDAR